MHQQMFKLQISLNFSVIPEYVFSERILVALKTAEVNWCHFTHVLTYLATYSFWSAMHELGFIINSCMAVQRL